MAENKYSVRIRQASAGINVLKPAIQKLARDGKTNTDQYRNLVNQLQEAQTEYDKLLRAEKRLLEERKSEKTKTKAAPKQGDLDVANATGNKSEVNKIAKEMQKAGVTPLGLDGKPLKGFEPEPTIETPPAVDKTKGADTSVETAAAPPAIKIPPKKIKTPPKTPTVVPEVVTGAKTETGVEDINAIYTLARSKYGNVDSIFLYDPELKQLLVDAVGDPATAQDDMDAAEFARRLGASDWATRNATTYARRDAERRQYTETLDKYNQQLELADTQDKKDAILAKIGQLKTTSTYARGLESAKAYIEATASGLTGTMSPERLDAFVKRMYDSGNDKDPNIINRELAALVSYKPGMQLGGAVGGDLTTLRATARANGFDLDTSFGSSINDWLQRLAKGESIETFKNTIRGAAKLGLPDKVANLLDQGLDLKDIYAPYRNVMASVLEVAPDSIGLDDKTLRGAIGPEKEMSIYDFQRQLRKDSRWQYTDNARQEASDSVLKVLRDFGFQG